MKLLFIDNDYDLVEMLTAWLKTLGYEVYRAYDIEKAKAEWMQRKPDLVIMNTVLRGTDMLALCREMRRKHDALVVVVTDHKDVHEEVRCLNMGADDYLCKPFLSSQLLAHICAVSRRARTTVEPCPSSVVTVGPIRVDSLRNEVTVHGKTSRLTPTESKLLHLLAINADDVCTTERIVTYVWGNDGEGDAELIKAHICHLRQKIEPRPAIPYYIRTIPGVGYILTRRSAEDSATRGSSRSLHLVSH